MHGLSAPRICIFSLSFGPFLRMAVWLGSAFPSSLFPYLVFG